jgi:hypothetical protein
MANDVVGVVVRIAVTPGKGDEFEAHRHLPESSSPAGVRLITVFRRR